MKARLRSFVMLPIFIVVLFVTALLASASSTVTFWTASPTTTSPIQNPLIYTEAWSANGINASSAKITLTYNSVSNTYPMSFWDNGWDPPQLRYQASGLKDGLYGVSVYVEDSLGNPATRDWQFTVKVLPKFSEISPANNTFNNNVNLIRAKVVDPNGTIDAASIQLKLNSTIITHSFDPATGYITYDNTLAAGSYQVNLSATDNSGNTASVAWAFTVDTTPPVLSGSPSNGSTVTSIPVSVLVRATDTISNLDNQSIKMLFNGNQVTPGFSYDYLWWIPKTDYTKGDITYNAGNLTDGEYPVSVEMKDKVGNLGSTSFRFYVAVPPVISNLSPANNTKAGVTTEISAVVKDPNGTINPASIAMTVNGTTVEAGKINFDAATGKVSVSYPGGLADGLYTVSLTAADMIGLQATAGPWSFEINTTPPSFSSHAPGINGTTTVSNPDIKVSIYDADKIKSGTPKMYVNDTLVSASFSYYQDNDMWYPDYTRGTISFKPVALRNGTNKVKVEARDEAGNLGVTTWYFTVQAPPKILAITPAPNSTTGREPEIVVDIHSNEALTEIVLTVQRQVVQPQVIPLDTYTTRLSYQPVDPFPNEEDVLLDLVVGNGYTTTRAWAYKTNIYGEMPGTTMASSDCNLCHSTVISNYKQANCTNGPCHTSNGVEEWNGKCLECHLTGSPPSTHHKWWILPHEILTNHSLAATNTARGCNSCHATVLTRTHNRNSYTCTTCHVSNPAREKNTLDLYLRGGGTVKVTRGDAANKQCVKCHTETLISTAHPTHSMTYGTVCQNCHSGRMDEETVYHSASCASCHSSTLSTTRIPTRTVRQAVERQKDSCFDCHQTAHGMLMNNFRGDIPLYLYNPEALAGTEQELKWTVPTQATIWFAETWMPDVMKGNVTKIAFSQRKTMDSATVHQYYLEQMALAGWGQPVNSTYVNGASHFELTFQKGNRYCVIWYYNGKVPNVEGTHPGGARIQIVYH